MARRRKQHIEPENHERWLVSYADLITLLFAFFVVMYAISSVNEGKYRVLSESITAAFRQPNRSMEPDQQGAIARSPHPVKGDYQQQPGALYPFPEGGKNWSTEALSDPTGQVSSIAAEARSILDNLIDSNLVSLEEHPFWLEIEISSSVLYPSASSQLSDSAKPVLQELGEMMSHFPNRIQVEGFTDNVPIKTFAFPSNWELSAARAATVVRLFAEAGVAPQRMAAIGYGEHRPLVSNDRESGRAANRRVVVIILAETMGGNTEDFHNLERMRKAFENMPGPVIDAL